ncbi:Dephospho-CoA kinase [Staphylococcus aureus]|nr:Dephospho-CoA kinase [Staphylococcus aureus]
MPKVIGLTGGIASGKSTVSELLSVFGFKVVDADKAARKLLKRGVKV